MVIMAAIADTIAAALEEIRRWLASNLTAQSQRVRQQFSMSSVKGNQP
jgi:hypothetical protein